MGTETKRNPASRGRFPTKRHPSALDHDNATAHLARVIAACGRQVVPKLIELLPVVGRGTMPWYRQMYSKIHAWALPCAHVLYTDYDGWPVRSLDDAFGLCGRAPLCAVGDTVTPISKLRRARG